jgi:hypothetical protein
LSAKEKAAVSGKCRTAFRCFQLNSLLQLKLQAPLNINKRDIWFRSDPPVLIVSITWHRTDEKFGEFLHKRLALSYFGNADSVSPPTLQPMKGVEC